MAQWDLQQELLPQHQRETKRPSLNPLRRMARAPILFIIISLICASLLFSSWNSNSRSVASQSEASTSTNTSSPAPSSLPLDTRPSSLAIPSHPPPPTLDTISPKTKNAFATFLASNPSASDSDPDDLNDSYFISVRTLAYQFLHAPETRTRHNYPFIVLVTIGVSEKKRERLRKDGAVVVEVKALETAEWFASENPQYKDVATKLRVWELVQFERVLLVDGDTILSRPLDDIFNEPALQLQKTFIEPDAISNDTEPNDIENKESTNLVAPQTYVFASSAETTMYHNFPPSEEGVDWVNINYLNAGFVVLQPSLELLDYYISIIQDPEKRFEPYFPEQDLWNWAHRREHEGGNMPWQKLNSTWNINFPKLEDLEGGVASMHEKFWSPADQRLKPFLYQWQGRMRGFWEAKAAEERRLISEM